MRNTITKLTIVDGWVQFPNRRFLLDPMFDALRRWPSHWRTLADTKPRISADDALSELKAQNVSKVIASTWWGPQGPMITNEEVAAVVRKLAAFASDPVQGESR